MGVILGANKALGLPEAPAKGAVLSIKVTLSPRCARDHADIRPEIPAPITATCL